IQLRIRSYGVALCEDERQPAVPIPPLEDIPFLHRSRQLAQRLPFSDRLGCYSRAAITLERNGILSGVRVGAAPIIAAAAAAIMAAAGSGVIRRTVLRIGYRLLILPHLHNRAVAHEENSRFRARSL